MHHFFHTDRLARVASWKTVWKESPLNERVNKKTQYSGKMGVEVTDEMKANGEKTEKG